LLNTVIVLPKLNPNTPTLMNGEVRLFKRKRSSVWQVVFTMDGRQVRVSSKKRILKEALEAARDIYLDYRVRQKNGLPVISKRFASVAALCRATMAEQLENGVGKKSFRDYIIVIDKYLVPFSCRQNRFMACSLVTPSLRSALISYRAIRRCATYWTTVHWI